jgi:beta-lactam-binding protein with PASTA domain
VPRVIGKTLGAARAAIAKAGCKPGAVTKTFSAKGKLGRVVGQSPAAGRKVALGTRVKLVVSKGARR